MPEKYLMENRFHLIHKSKPLKYSPDISDSLRILLWYTPNTNGYQSDTDPIISEDSLTEETFDYFCNELGVPEGSRICRDKTEIDYINQNILNTFPENPESKLIMLFDSGHTKTYWLLKHLRNSLAHGRFNITNNEFIGFDNYNQAYNFFIRLEIKKLQDVLNSMRPDHGVLPDNPPNYVETLIRDGIKNIDSFKILDLQSHIPTSGDFIVKNEELNMEASFDIKLFSRRPRLDAKKYKMHSYSNEKILFVCILPKIVLDNEMIELYNHSNMIMLDKPRLKQFLHKNDVITEQMKRSLDR